MNAAYDWFLSLRLLDFVDILLVLLLFYEGYKLLKGTGATRVFVGLILLIIFWRIVDFLNLRFTSELLGSIVNVGVLAIFIVFQPEIRRFLLLFGSRSFLERNGRELGVLRFLSKASTPKLNFDPILDACQNLSRTSTGALIVFAKENELTYPISTGECIDARISAQLLENIFFKNSPLHDGAVIIKHNKIEAARCILPVSANQNISASLGLRHRAAVGITEQTDALAIVVSEQTGAISFVKAGRINKRIEREELLALLEAEFIPHTKKENHKSDEPKR